MHERGNTEKYKMRSKTRYTTVVACVFAVAAGMAFFGCGGGDGDEGDSGDGDSTNPVPTHVVGIAAIGAEESVSGIDGAHPDIAMDSQGKLHIALDKNRGTELFLYHKGASGWAGGLFASAQPGGTYNASRMYIPILATDAAGRAFLSCTLGNKGGGLYLGQGLFCFEDIASSPVSPTWFQTTTDTAGTGVAAVDPYEPGKVILMTVDGLWHKFNSFGNEVSEGQLNVGESGEKIRFKIAPRSGRAGVWHMAMCGIKGLDGHTSGLDGQYQNSVRQAAGRPAVSWAGRGTYPEMAGDYIHPGISIDLVNPEVCYIAAAFDAGISVNIWDGSRMLYDATALPVVDANGTVGIERMGPAWAPVAGGGSFLAWASGGRIKMKLFHSDGTSGPTLDICDGHRAAMCTDGSLYIHLAYNKAGQVYYRRLTLEAQ